MIGQVIAGALAGFGEKAAFLTRMKAKEVKVLPFLKKNQESGVSAPADTITREPDNDEEFDSLEVAAEDILFAIEQKDKKALARALQAAYDICMEGPQ